jgi:hypothetical protein
MRTLRLDNNPLGLAPDVTRMPRLQALDLSHTHIQDWPDGVLARHRPKGFFLDLQNTQIRTVPEAITGSPQAWLIARARLDVDRLSDLSRVKLHAYRDAAKLPRENIYDPLAANARNKWPLDVDSDLWGGNSAGLGTYREEAWDRLMNEPNSDSFFRIIQRLTTSQDYKDGGESRLQLSKRVWDLIDAMDLDTTLREKLLSIARNPQNCTDANTEVFNNMGVEALASRAYSYSTSMEEREESLLRLSKGASRLNRVNDIARADMASRPTRNEEVEVYLAYQTFLAKRLGLPWQSESMTFRHIARVTDETLDSAYNTVLEQEEGDGLVNGMLDLEFWNQYLRERYPARMQINEQLYNQKMDDLEEQRSNPGNGEPMSDQTYSDRVTDLGYERQQLARALTRELLAKHVL